MVPVKSLKLPKQHIRLAKIKARTIDCKVGQAGMGEGTGRLEESLEFNLVMKDQKPNLSDL